MNPLQRLETALREAFERPVWALGGQRLHPARLGDLLEDAMEQGRLSLASGTFVPERYALLVHPDDYRRFRALVGAVEQGLAEHLEAVRQAQHLQCRRPITVQLRPDEGVRRGEAEVDAAFLERGGTSPAIARTPQGSAPPLGATMELDRRAVLAEATRIASTMTEPILGKLEALDQQGQTVGAEYGIAVLPCTIGRSPECDIVLEDLRVSRRHARLTRDGEAFIIEDLGSANGTWLDGARIEQAHVHDGATLTLGGPRFRLRLWS
ncbi:MAG TPA: FHA domain-containing protein [Dehalococcoidia bacterium]|nr:FHA domain-containing protein [Dehalococcoidia bacterium]